jgi:hypothetical protein
VEENIPIYLISRDKKQNRASIDGSLPVKVEMDGFTRKKSQLIKPKTLDTLVHHGETR